MTKSIKGLVEHLEKQIARKDASDPNASWCLGELKKYLDEKDIIGEMLLNETVCQWCNMPRNGRHTVHMESFGSFSVCEACFELYLKGDYEQLKSRIGQVHGKV